MHLAHTSDPLQSYAGGCTKLTAARVTSSYPSYGDNFQIHFAALLTSPSKFVSLGSLHVQSGFVTVHPPDSSHLSKSVAVAEYQVPCDLI